VRLRRACIDIGSNTTRLLVADVDGEGLSEVAVQRSFTRIGGACAADGTIAEEKIWEVAAVVSEQVRAARELGVESPRIVATGAVRAAPNRTVFTTAVEEASGLVMAILPGEEEARLAFIGATRTLSRPPPGPIGVVDVGGGSTELAVGTRAEGVTWWRSLPIGSGVLADAHLQSDPPDEAEVGAVRERVAGMLDDLDAPRPETVIAVGGSATSLYRLIGPLLSPVALERGVALLCAMPAAEAATRFALEPERVRLLPAGICLLLGAARAFGTPLVVGRGGLREGLLLEEDPAP
jgi:exopolyphosphatase / guanosine-5'-triphosphate,3'-diphosphate pyrophosphatase